MTFVIGRLTTRRAARSGALWGLIFLTLVVASAGAYASSFPTAASRATLAHGFGGNAGVAALLGPAEHLDTVAGFTAWRTMMLLSVIGAIWGLFLATRLLRGEEEAGRWELLLAGPTTRRRATLQAIAGLGAGVAALWAVTALAAVAIGAAPKVHFSTTASLFLATALTANAAVFVAVGAVTSQLAGTRRQANAIGAGFLGAAYLVRMIADVDVGLRWLRWVTPLGWAEEFHPLTGSRPLVLVPFVMVTAAFTGLTIALASKRDVGASTLPSRDTSPPHVGLLSGATGLSARLVRPGAIGWVIGLATMAFVGLISRAAADVATGSDSIARALARLGGQQGGARAYLGLAFAFAAALVAFAAAGQIGATRSEEADGFLDNLLVRPVSRRRWLLGRLAIASVLLVVLGVVGGAAAWVGAASQHTGIAFGDLVLAGVNIVPPALFVLGVGGLVYGVQPRRAPAVAYALVTWSLLIQVVAALLTTNRWLLDSSVLHHIAPAPATDPNWTSAMWLAGLGVAAAAVGLAAFNRRDVVGS